MKVCFVSHYGEKAGATLMLLRLVDGLRARGVECSVLLPWDGSLREEFGTRGIAHAIFPYRVWAYRGGPLRDRLRDLWELRQLGPIVSQLRRWDVDLVVTNTSTVPLGAFAALVLRKPHVWYIHEFGRADHGLSFYLGYTLTGKLISALSKSVIVNSRAVGDFFSRYIPREKINVIYCGVDSPRQDGIRAGLRDRPRLPRLVMMGTYHPGKGHVVAIRALKHLMDQHLKAELVFAGIIADLSYFHSLKRAAAECQVENAVFFETYQDAPGTLMADGDVILMCSRSEAFGLVTVEAMKLGKPVIGARSGATPELIQDGVTGLLYEPGDPADLAAKIRFLLENPAVAKSMGETARRSADARFSMEAYVDAVLRVLKEAVHRAEPGTGLATGSS